MRIPPHAQRELKPNHVNFILKNFDLDKFGVLTVSSRRGAFYIVDGQHRFEALKQWLGEGWEDDKIECRVHEGLSEAQEAELFLDLNAALTVAVFDKFNVSVSAKREVETKIKKLLEKEGLRISRDSIPGAVRAVGTVRKVYVRAGSEMFCKAMRIIRDAFGDAGFEAPVIDGMGHLCQRYDGLIDEDLAVDRLSAMHGGVKGLLNAAEKLHKQTGTGRPQCVAAASVDVINRGLRGKGKLASWWAED